MAYRDRIEARFGVAAIRQAVSSLAERLQPVGTCVYGAGFEARGDVLAAIGILLGAEAQLEQGAELVRRARVVGQVEDLDAARRNYRHER
jgi:hypothetical protein